MAERMQQTLIIFLLLSVVVQSARAATCDDSDSIALSYFLLENPLGGPIINSWQASDDCCTWPGITCNWAGKVQAINIVNPTGPNFKPPATSYQVASGLGALNELVTLVLTNVSLNGNIPAAWGNLLKLQTLHAEQCNLVGEVPPELCNMSKLTTLNLSNNFLNGTYPDCLSNMTSIKSINFSGNQVSGKLPAAGPAAGPASA